MSVEKSSVQSANWLGTLSNALDVGVLVLSADKRLTFASNFAATLLGCAGPAELETRWEELVPALEKALGKPLEKLGPRVRLSLEVKTSHGTFRLRWIIYPLSDENCEGYLCLVKDLATIEALEEELQLATRFMSFARLYMVVAHDLRAPLNAMALNIQLLKESLVEEALEEEARKAHAAKRTSFVTVIDEELSRLARSLDSFLRQSEPPREESEVFDFGELIRDVVALLGALASYQRVALDVVIPDQRFPVRGNRDVLKQALVNVAINAFDAMPKGGRLTIELERGKDRLAARITDTGPGIAREHQDKIWEIFFTTKKRGSGIGLFVARSAMERHGGEIVVESTGPQGTCFKLDLPLRERA